MSSSDESRRLFASPRPNRQLAGEEFHCHVQVPAYQLRQSGVLRHRHLGLDRVALAGRIGAQTVPSPRVASQTMNHATDLRLIERF